MFVKERKKKEKKGSISLVLALLLCASLVLGSVSFAFAFNDIDDPEVSIAANTLKGIGILDGTSASTYNPGGTLTRSEACKLMINMLGKGSKVNTMARKTLFSDVRAGKWYTGYVNLAYSEGIVNGYGNGNFGPTDIITYGQLATMILRMLGYTSSDVGSIWPGDYTALCEELGISSGLNLSDNGSLTRGDAAIMLYRSLSAGMKNGGKAYYSTMSCISSVKDGIVYNAEGDAAGFIPGTNIYADAVVKSASASQIIDTDGNKYKISTAKVVSGYTATDFASGGYLIVNAAAGNTVRIFYNESGVATFVYVMGSDANASEISAERGYMVQGYISAATPSMSSAETITVAGYKFNVNQSALNSLASYKIGSKVTLLLTDDLKVYDVKSSSYNCEMIGILSENGKNVTLLGSGITLSAANVKMDYSSAKGNLVSVNMTALDTISCTKLANLSNYSGTLDVKNNTYKGVKLSSYCNIFEVSGQSYLYSLEGEAGKASYDFSAIDWTGSIDDVYARYVHLDDAGEIDILVLCDITGNNYSYGKMTKASKGITINKNNGLGSENYDSVTVANGKGNTSYIYSNYTYEGFGGVSLSASNSNYNTVCKVNELTGFYMNTSSDSLYTKTASDGSTIWYINHEDEEYKINPNVQVYLNRTDSWTSGTSTLGSLIADGYNISFYNDGSASEGGQVRIIAAY